MAAKRLLLDTNVVVAALLWSGPPAQLLDRAVEHELGLLSSPALLAELRTTLGYTKFAKRMGGLQTNIEALMRKYESIVERVEPAGVPRVVPGDPDDDHVIAAAVAGQVDLVVSGDRHLLRLEHHAGIAIVSVREALERLTRQT